MLDDKRLANVPATDRSPVGHDSQRLTKWGSRIKMRSRKEAKASDIESLNNLQVRTQTEKPLATEFWPMGKTNMDQ